MPRKTKTKKQKSKETKKQTATKRRKTTRRKVAKRRAPKRTARKKQASKKAHSATEAMLESQPTELIEPRQYVNINEYDPKLAFKKQLMWFIVTILAVAVVVTWFFSLRRGIGQSNGDDINLLTQETQSTIEELKTAFTEIKEGLDQTKEELEKEQELEQARQEVFAKLQENLQKNNWPEHSSEIIGLSLQYPDDWAKAEEAERLTLTTDNDNLEISAQIIIDRLENDGNSLEDWSDNWYKTIDTNILWQPASINDLEIDNQPTIKYLADEPEANMTHYTIFVSQEDYIYSINVSMPTDNDLYEIIVENILSSIKFTEG